MKIQYFGSCNLTFCALSTHQRSDRSRSRTLKAHQRRRPPATQSPCCNQSAPPPHQRCSNRWCRRASRRSIWLAHARWNDCREWTSTTCARRRPPRDQPRTAAKHLRRCPQSTRTACSRSGGRAEAHSTAHSRVPLSDRRSRQCCRRSSSRSIPCLFSLLIDGVVIRWSSHLTS